MLGWSFSYLGANSLDTSDVTIVKRDAAKQRAMPYLASTSAAAQSQKLMLQALVRNPWE